MFFSIIIPTRNRAKLLTRCLNAISRQSFTDYEVIVIDDGSNPDELFAYQDIISSHANFRLIKISENAKLGSGVSIVRNTGINEAKGKYIAFCDDDDFWVDENHLSIAHDTLQNCKYDVYIGNQKAVLSNDEISYDNWLPELSRNVKNYISVSVENNTYQLELKDLMREQEFPHLNILIARTEICKKINGFWERITYLEDLDFYLRLINSSKHFCFRNSVVSQHNIPDPQVIKSISNSVPETDRYLHVISVGHHILANCENKFIAKRCMRIIGDKLRLVSRDLHCQNKYYNAYLCAKNALVYNFTFKWMLFTFYLKILTLFK